MTNPIPDIPANERMCPFCTCMEVRQVYDGYNTYSISCKKGYFHRMEPDAFELASTLIYARTCKDFEVGVLLGHA